MTELVRKRRAHVCALLVVLSGLMVLPALAWAGGSGGTGGAGLGSSGGSSNTPTASPSPTGPVSASGDGITLNTSAATLLRSGLSFSGTASSSAAGKTIEIERLGHQTGWRWTPTVSTTIRSGGGFSVTWNTNHIGRFSIRAIVVQAAARTATAAPTLTVTVYRSSLATLYGPGFYGHRTACGRRLTRTMIGVASRTLRCGTSVAILYQGRTMIVPVIDRGPYANGADWDLTMATGRALGVTGTARIGAVSLPRPPASPGS